MLQNRYLLMLFSLYALMNYRIKCVYVTNLKWPIPDTAQQSLLTSLANDFQTC